jgi:hypothetical protein
MSPCELVAGLVSGVMTFVTSQLGFTVGVTDGISSGISIAIVVVADPSHPCGTAKVSTVYEPAAVESGVTPTCALAERGTATARSSPNPSPVDARVKGVDFFIVGP